MADGRLAEAERLGQVADARLVAGLSLDQAEQAQPRRVGDRLQRRRELLGVAGIERRLQERRTGRGDAWRVVCTEFILTDIDDRVIMPPRTSIVVDTEGELRCRRRSIRSRSTTSTRPPTGWPRSSPGSSPRRRSPATSPSRWSMLEGARINVFVPVLAHRFARERLRALAQAEGVLTKDQPEVLFVCVHNAGRSQMAAGLVKLRSQGRIHVRTAGSAPSAEIDAAVVEAMARARHRRGGGVPEAAHRRGRARRRRRDHDGLRRRLPDLPRKALRGLGSRRPGRAGSRRGAARSATRSTGGSATCSPSCCPTPRSRWPDPRCENRLG